LDKNSGFISEKTFSNRGNLLTTKKAWPEKIGNSQLGGKYPGGAQSPEKEGESKSQKGFKTLGIWWTPGKSLKRKGSSPPPEKRPPGGTPLLKGF